MLTIEPSLRCSLADLLRGGELDELDERRKDEWLPNVGPCIDDGWATGGEDGHVHYKVGTEPVKSSRKR
jgi:hypothetical protein